MCETAFLVDELVKLLVVFVVFIIRHHYFVCLVSCELVLLQLLYWFYSIHNTTHQICPYLSLIQCLNIMHNLYNVFKWSDIDVI